MALNKDAISSIILDEVLLGSEFSYAQLRGVEHAAMRILELLKEHINRPAPAAFYPNRACNCGGERAKSKHYDWCALNAPRNQR